MSTPVFRENLRLICLFLAVMLVNVPQCRAQTDGELNQTSFSNLSARQLQELAEAAARSKLRPVEIDAKAVGRELRFQVKLAPNPATVRWAIVINAPSARIRAEDRKFQKNGYERTLTERSRLGRQILSTAVWTREARPAEKLVLPEGPVPAHGDVVEEFQAVDDFFTAFLPKFNASGASVAIAHHGKPVYERAFGYSDVAKKTPLKTTQPMRIASLSKALTAVTVLRLVQQRKLLLDDAVLPWLEKKGFRLPSDGDRRWHDITIRHLLQHAGGWDQKASGDPTFQVVEVTAEYKLKKSASTRHLIRYQMQRPLDFAPGTKSVYSNFGYMLLGRIIEAASEMDYEVAVENLVLRPAGMEQTSLARTALHLQKPDEPTYHMQTTIWLPPYWTSLDDFTRGNSTFVDDTAEPYGRWKIEVMDSTGGWLSTPADLLKLVSSLDREPGGLLVPTTVEQMVARPEFAGEASLSRWEGLGWHVYSPFREIPKALDECFISRQGALAGTSAIVSHYAGGWSYVVLFNCDTAPDGSKLANLVGPGLTEILDGCRLED